MSDGVAPICVAPDPHGPIRPEDDGGCAIGNGRPEPPTILVVEDEVLIRFSVADYLRDGGYRVIGVKTAEEAQALIRAGEPVAILFSDIDLGPGLSGVDLAQWTRDHDGAIRIILTSGVAHITDAASAEFCDRPLLRKPYSYRALGEHITALLGATDRHSV